MEPVKAADGVREQEHFCGSKEVRPFRGSTRKKEADISKGLPAGRQRECRSAQGVKGVSNRDAIDRRLGGRPGHSSLRKPGKGGKTPNNTKKTPKKKKKGGHRIGNVSRQVS